MTHLPEDQLLNTLELSGEVTLEEVHHAYQRLKRLYEDEGASFLAPSMDEFSPEARQDILAELQAAHKALCQRFEAIQPPTPQILAPVLDEADLPLDGPSLRSVREACGASLEYLAAQTHIRTEFLAALEAERFEDLPPASVNVRGFLSAYLMELGLPVDAIAAGYMQRFQQWQTARKA